jgi:hypothetical protein
MASLLGGSSIVVSSVGTVQIRGGKDLGARQILVETSGLGTGILTVGSSGVTATSPGAAAAAFNDTRGHAVILTTNAASGSMAGMSTTAVDDTQTQWDFDSCFNFATGASVAAVRFWVGLFSATPEASDDPAIHIAGFRFSTGASDPAIMAVAKDGTTINAVTTGVALNASGFYALRINARNNGTVLDYYVNGVLTNTLTTNLPTVSQMLAMRCQVTSLAAASKTIGFYAMETWQSSPGT